MMRIRLPEDLKAKIKGFADENHRSMNAEIVARLEVSLSEEEPTPETTRGPAFLKKVRQDQIARLDDDVARIKLTLEKMGVELEPLPDWPRYD